MKSRKSPSFGRDTQSVVGRNRDGIGRILQGCTVYSRVSDDRFTIYLGLLSFVVNHPWSGISSIVPPRRGRLSV